MSWMMAAQVGKVGLEYLGAQQKAAADEANYRANRQRAAIAQDLKIQQINRRVIQESEAATQAKLDMQIAALENAERRAVVAAEAGLAGGSTVDNFINDPTIKRLRADTQINENIRNLQQQAELDKIGVTAETASRINSMPRGQEPSFLQYAVKAGATAYSVYEQEQALLPENVAKRQLAIEEAKVNAGEEFVEPLPSFFDSFTSFFKPQ